MATNGITPLNTTYVLDKSAADTHTGKLINAYGGGSADIEAQGGWLGMVATSPGRAYMRPVYVTPGGGIPLRIYFVTRAPKTSTTSPYWPVTWSVWIPYGVRLASDAVSATLTHLNSFNYTNLQVLTYWNLGPDGDTPSRYGIQVQADVSSRTTLTQPQLVGYIDINR